MAPEIDLERGLLGGAFGGLASLVAAPFAGLVGAGYVATRAISDRISNPDKPVFDTAVEAAYDAGSYFLGGAAGSLLR